MFEFLDHEIIVATIMLFFSFFVLDASWHAKKKGSQRKVKRVKGIGWAYIVIMASPFIGSYILMLDAQESIRRFKSNVTLKCMSEEVPYLVSKEEKWKVKGVYFTKESLLLRADKCEEF